MNATIKPTSCLSAPARMLLEALTPKERKMVRKNYPNPVKRNQLIRKLRAKGWKCITVAEVSGYTQTNITRICKEKEARAAERRKD